ncbi:MAG: carboxypeptidase regulatory-like domain-containing protein [Bryobacteraceae bacterium]
MNKISSQKLACVLGALVMATIFAAPQAFGQAFTATLAGVVTDGTDAAIPGATVKIRNQATNDARQTTTSGEGRYIFSQLPPGTYEVTAETAGFKTLVRSGVGLSVSQTAELNLSMELGDVTQTVQVTEGAPILDTQTANRAVTLSSQQVLDLPVNARNPFVLVHVNAGVIAVRTGISQATQDQNHNRFSMNGGRGQAGLTMIDGVPSSAVDWGGLIASPGVDSVQEVQIVRNIFDAQYGKSDGSVVSMVTRGGSNDWHGTLFEFLRNDNLDANSWANNRAGRERVEFQRNQFGGNFSGPILRSKRLFFFTGYEGLRQGSPGLNVSTVPTALERQGDFSQSLNSRGALIPIFNPHTTRQNPNGSGLIRDPFPGNRIPQALFDPVGSKVLDLYPQPNTQGDAFTNARNFAAAGKTVAVNDRLDVRIDWAKSEKFTMFGRLTKAWQKQTAPVYFGNGADTNFSDQNPRHGIVIGATIVPNPTWVVNTQLGSGRWREVQISPSQGRSATDLGFASSLVAQFQPQTYPGFAAQDYTSLNNRRFLDVPRETHNLQVNVTKELGSHSLKFGFSGEVARLNRTDFYTPQFNFTRGLTSGPTASVTSTTSGNGIASLLLGTGSGGNVPTNAATSRTLEYYGLYFQDGWRATRRLTLNYGLRWEVQLPETERYNRLNYFDYAASNPLSQQVGRPLQGGFVFVDANNRYPRATDWRNFAPRIGLAYKITDKLVMRTGYGIFYPQVSSLGGEAGFSTTTSWLATEGGDGFVPVNRLSNPYPQGLNQPIGTSQGANTLIGESIGGTQYAFSNPYVQSFSLDFQYEFDRSTVLELGYTGTQSRKLAFGVGRNANQLPTHLLSQGAALNTPVDNPFFGIIPGGPLAGRTIPQHRLLRPYPLWQNVNLPTNTPGATASFNALVARFNKRIGSSMNLLATYQWSKAIDNASEWQGWEVGDTVRDYYDLSRDRSISAHDLPHSFVAALVYELPVGRGRKIGADLPKVADALLGGWQVSTIVRFASGLPLQLTAPNNLGPFGFGVQRPNIGNLKDLNVSNRTPDRWFNADALSAPGAFELGSAPRWIPNLRFGRTKHADLAVMKNFRWGERMRIQFRGEFFNLTNTPQFGRANTTLGNPVIGQVTGTTNVGPRNTQLGVRIQF